jgi:hypothetical protein
MKCVLFVSGLEVYNRGLGNSSTTVMFSSIYSMDKLKNPYFLLFKNIISLYPLDFYITLMRKQYGIQ